MNYATWNLRSIEDGYLDGPESAIVARGGSAQAIWSNGPVENGATILGKVSGDVSGLEEWGLLEVSRTEAEEFISLNFTPFTDFQGITHDVQGALAVLD